MNEPDKQIEDSKFNVHQWGDMTYRTLKSQDEIWNKLFSPVTEPAIEFSGVICLDCNDNGVNIWYDAKGNIKEVWSQDENKDARV